MHNHNGQVQDTLTIIIYTMIEMLIFVDWYSSSRPLIVFMILYEYGYVIIVDPPPPSYPKNGSFYRVHIRSKLLKIYTACVRLDSY